MTVDERIAAVEAQALDTADRFIAEAIDPDERKRLHRQLIEQRNKLNRLRVLQADQASASQPLAE